AAGINDFGVRGYGGPIRRRSRIGDSAVLDTHQALGDRRSSGADDELAVANPGGSRCMPHLPRLPRAAMRCIVRLGTQDTASRSRCLPPGRKVQTLMYFADVTVERECESATSKRASSLDLPPRSWRGTLTEPAAVRSA